MTGTITKRGKGVYLLRLDLGRDESGKRVRHVETVRGPRDQAEQRLRDLLKDHDTGRWTEPSAMPLREYMTEWLKTGAKPKVSKKSLEVYETLIRLYVTPKLGFIALNKLTPMMIQRLYQELGEGGKGSAGRKGDTEWPPLAAATIRKVHATLNQALRTACKWRMLAYPPTADVDPPRLPRERKIRALSKAQLDAFLAAAETDRYAPYWLAAVHSGCRPEELLGLRWPRVLFDQSAISIEEVLIRPRSIKGGPSWWLDPPKTRSGRRVVTLPLPVMRALEKHRLRQNEEKAFYGESYKDNGFVFAAHQGQPLRSDKMGAEHFKAILKKAGLPPETRVYDLRHSHASVMIAHGVDAKVVSERMGHASVAFTLDTYVHLVEDQQKAAAQVLDRLFYGASSG